jgi:hypothetical protein
MANPKDPFKEQLEQILKIENEEVNPYGKPFKDLSFQEKELVRTRLDFIPEQSVTKAKINARRRRSKEKKDKGLHTVIILGHFNPKTETLIKEKIKELGYKYPASLINDAVEDFLGIPRGSSLSENWKENR